MQKARILQFDRMIVAWHRSSELSRRLDDIPGVGPALATALVACITDPKVFRSGRDSVPEESGTCADGTAVPAGISRQAVSLALGHWQSLMTVVAQTQTTNPGPGVRISSGARHFFNHLATAIPACYRDATESAEGSRYFMVFFVGRP
jgi:hypothetical protein